MRIEEFDYNLPKSLIAQYPSPRRGESRLMVLGRTRSAIEHRNFGELPDYLRSGDLLVMNNTRVLPARLIGNKETGGKVEILLVPSWNGTNPVRNSSGALNPALRGGTPYGAEPGIILKSNPAEEQGGIISNGAKGEWEVLIRNSEKVKGGTRIQFGQEAYGELKEVNAGRGKIAFPEGRQIEDVLRNFGHIPLPPYIKREDEPLDRDRYQTIIAEKDGSIAAPTAGLHFTESMIQTLKEKGVGVALITLHIGPGTFTPVKAEEVEKHPMEKEWVEITEEVAVEINQAKERGGRVIAVGTTTTRALESFSERGGRMKPGRGHASLFIHPPYPFRVIDGLVTNFHLPKSTLIMLVSAFAGRDFILNAYQEAVKKEYHFYSYGDAMLIL
jgi:S-adenosylmethionine:tRNA ribosyltransferase-isomerase